MPPDKYRAKEVPFDWNKYFFSDALKRRNAYFIHLCNTEGRNYIADGYPKELNTLDKVGISIFSAGLSDYPVKKEAINWKVWGTNHEYDDPINARYQIAANQNPYIWSRGIRFPPSEEMLKEFNGTEQTNNIIEQMYGNGSIYRKATNSQGKLISVKKLNNENEIQARYLVLTRELPARDEYMKNLGIYETESIVYDRQEKKLLNYYHDFTMATYLDSTRGSGQNTLIKWGNEVSCYPIKETKIKDFN